MNVQKGNKGKIHKVDPNHWASRKVGTSYGTVCNMTVLLDNGYITTSDHEKWSENLKLSGVTCKKCLKVLGKLVFEGKWRMEEKREGTIFLIDEDGEVSEFDNLQELYEYMAMECEYEAGDIIHDLEHDNIRMIRGSNILVRPKMETREEMVGLEEV